MATNNNVESEGRVRRDEAHHGPAEQNGPSTNGVPADGQVDPRMARAAEMVDHLAEKMASWTRSLGRNILWLGERLREEAEDIWTEAQSIRRGEKP